MDLYQTESCFVCNRDVLDKGVLLSMESTLYSETAFPTKLMQLLGDAFMVVILEDDKICLRCANLINQTDKLEQDLKKTKSIIIGFLNEKYDLEREEELGEELQDPEFQTDHDDEKLMHSPTVNDKYTYDERYKTNNNPDNLDGLFETNLISENACGIRIKSEQVLDSCQNINYSNAHNISENCENTMSKALLKKLPEDDLTFKEKNLTLVPSQSELNQIFPEPQDIVVLEELKKEKYSADYSVNNVQISPLYKNKHFPTINETSEKTVAVLECDCTHFDENKSEIQLLCKDSSNIKDIKDNLICKLVPNVEIPKNFSFQASITDLTKIEVENELKEDSKRQTFSSKLGKRNNGKGIRKERTKNTVRKLRPILPKVSNIEEVLSSLYIIKNSDSILSNEILNDHSKYNIPIKSETCDVVKYTKEIKSLSNIEGKTNSNKCILNNIEPLSYITKTPLNGDFKAFCKICNVDFIDPKAWESHKKEHVQDSKNFKCSFCPKSFKRKYSVKNHEVLHTGNYAQYCEFCGQGFATLPKLEQHRRSHTKEESFMCDVCGKKFHFRGTYWIHRKWHDNPFPYKCDECGRLFKHSSQLSIHRRKHRGERPYKCSFCPLTFNVSSTLKRHLVLHTKQYPYKCVVCDQGFTTRSKYTDHLAKKHDMFVEKLTTDPKNYKMVIYDNARKESGVESKSTLKTMDLSESDCNIEISENAELFFHNKPDDCHLEIILPSSTVMSDNSLSKWLN